MAAGSIREIAAAARAGDASCRELADAALARAEARASLNAFARLEPEHALQEADEIQRRIGAGDAPPLAGVPHATKDIFNVRGLETSCASKILGGYRSPYDSTVALRGREAGLVLMGKTNMDEFAMGSSGENSAFGPTLNPWDPSRVAGGSSSGSAAAVAAGVVPLAFGTDTGGSVRQPASFCGVCGLKPTYGRISRYGIVAFASSLDQAGVFARDVLDLALAAGAVIGHDPRDSTSLEDEADDLARDAERGLAGMCVGVPEEFLGEGLDGDVRAAVDDALGVFSDLGAEVRRVKLPNLRFSIPAYYVLSSAEASSNLSRYDGVRFGMRSEGGEDLAGMYADTREEGFGAEVKRRILVGTYVLSYGYYDAYYRHAQKVRHLIAGDYRAAFGECDVLLGPTTPTTAFRLGEKASDPVQMYLSDIYTCSVNLAGLPGMSIPCGFDAAGLPIGMQLIAPACAEPTLVRFGHQYQTATDWHTRRPPQ